MPKVTVELEYEQVDAIVLQELKKCYEQLLQDWYNKLAVFDSRDDHWDLLFGFEKVIEHFSEPRAFDDYMSSFPLRQRD